MDTNKTVTFAAEPTKSTRELYEGIGLEVRVDPNVFRSPRAQLLSITKALNANKRSNTLVDDIREAQDRIREHG